MQLNFLKNFYKIKPIEKLYLFPVGKMPSIKKMQTAKNKMTVEEEKRRGKDEWDGSWRK